MRYIFIVHFIAVVLSATSFCEEEPGKAPVSMHEISSESREKDTKEPGGVLLIDLRQKKAIKVERDANGDYKLLPLRLYRRYEPLIKKYVFDLSTQQGRFSSTPHFLLPLSDLPGEWVGAEKDVAFVFVGGEKKGWDLWKEIRAEDARGEYVFWNLSDPPTESVHYHSVTKKDIGGR